MTSPLGNAGKPSFTPTSTVPVGAVRRVSTATARPAAAAGADGRYSLQIFHTTRTPFANPDKQRGTADEFRAAVMGMSTHYGRIEVDAGKNTLTFQVERAAFPNWDGRAQVRPFELHNEVLSYHVPKTPTGATPVSVWRRVARM